MDINELMYFESSDLYSSYCLALSEGGLVYYSIADDIEKPNVEWKIVCIDEKALGYHH